MFIDTITTDEKRLLLIESDGVVKLYERHSGAWEPIEPQDAEGLVMAGKAHIQGILLSNPTQEKPR